MDESARQGATHEPPLEPPLHLSAFSDLDSTPPWGRATGGGAGGSLEVDSVSGLEAFIELKDSRSRSMRASACSIV